jgi:hypothetical protein
MSKEEDGVPKHYEICMKWRAIGRREGLEEAAKVAEMDWTNLGSGWRTEDRIAAAIRARLTQGTDRENPDGSTADSR